MSREGKEVDFSIDFRRTFLIRGTSSCKVRGQCTQPMFSENFRYTLERGEEILKVGMS